MVNHHTAIRGDLLWPDGVIRPGILEIADGRILSVNPPREQLQPSSGNTLVVPTGGVAAPGFIDLQINGAFGKDFSTDPSTMLPVAKQLPSSGVTAFLGTIITAPLEIYREAVQVVKDSQSLQGAQLLGLHCEGPYLNPVFKGAHPPGHLRLPDQQAEEIYDPAAVRLVTLAPELPGALKLIQDLRTRSIVVGLGHSNATYTQTRAAFESGAAWSTHLFNAMRPFQHREPGITGALLSEPGACVALIPDGIHLHPAVLSLVFRLKGAQGITLISDAVAAAGMPPGSYTLGDQQVLVDETSVRLADGTLAGANMLMDGAVRNIVNLAQVSRAEALHMASATPARVLGLEDQGHLETGKRADIVILDSQLQVRLTLVGGEIVYEQTGSLQ